MDNLSSRQRILIATLLSFLFFIAYDHFYLSKLRLNEANVTKSSMAAPDSPKSTQVNSPVVEDVTKQAPSATPMSQTLVKFKGSNFHGSIDATGRIDSFILDEEKYKDEKGKAIALIGGTNRPFPLEIRFGDSKLNELAFSTPYRANLSELDLTKGNNEVVLTQNIADVTVTKKIKFDDNGRYELSVDVSNNSLFYITPGLRPNVSIDGFTVHGALIRKNDGKLEILKDGSVKADERFAGSSIASANDRYYTTLFYSNSSNLDVVVSKTSSDDSLIFIEAKGGLKVQGFIGPKTHKLLTNIDPMLEDVIEYGWFTWIAKPVFKLLNWFNGFFGNWGWAIVAMTILLRIVLLPLTYRGMMSMNKLRDLAPKIKELQAKYKGEPQKMQAHMMELYKKHGANPMGGCLPIVLQIPIFFAVYRVLLNAIELKGAQWILWIHDLAVMDPYYILPVLMGITMFLQQKLTPTNFTDPMQEKIMKWLPLIFTFFFFTFPAGLTLYWFTNNVCSVLQQLFINKMFAKHKAAKIAEAKHEN